MLKKLIKHEFIATARIYLPMYALIIVLTPIFGLMFRFGSSLNTGIITSITCGLGFIGFVFATIALFVASTIFIIVRFYRTTATAEAYLTFTVPAKPAQILGSKLLVASIWQLLTMVIIIAAMLSMLFICDRDLNIFLDTAIPELFGNADVANTLTATLLFTIFGILIGTPVSILFYYCAIMLGQLFNDHRVAVSFGMYVAITTVNQIASIIITVPFAIAESTFSMSEESQTLNFLLNYNTSSMLGTCLNLVFGIACYITTWSIMKKKINIR
jgi:hypothetical protein